MTDKTTTWTEGPWTWERDGTHAESYSLSPGVLLTSLPDGTPWGDEIDQANARLIAAAPEMAQLLAISASLLHQIERELGSSILAETDGAGIQHQLTYDAWSDRLLDQGNEIYALLARIKGEGA